MKKYKKYIVSLFFFAILFVSLPMILSQNKAFAATCTDPRTGSTHTIGSSYNECTNSASYCATHGCPIGTTCKVSVSASSVAGQCAWSCSPAAGAASCGGKPPAPSPKPGTNTAPPKTGGSTAPYVGMQCGGTNSFSSCQKIGTCGNTGGGVCGNSLMCCPNTMTNSNGQPQSDTCTPSGGNCFTNACPANTSTYTYTPDTTKTCYTSSVICCRATAKKVTADTGFTINGVTSSSVATTVKTGVVTLNRTDNTSSVTSASTLGTASYAITGTFTYDPATHAFLNHNLDLGNLPAGNYILAMHVDGNLDAQVTQNAGAVTVFKIAPGDTVKTDIVNLTPGDVAPGAGDNFIDIIDYNKLVNCEGKPIDGDCKSEDLNDDGKIDQGDIDLLMLHFGSLGYSLQKPGFSCQIDPQCQSGQQSLQLCTLICTRQQ
jgi:hypothetical protein